MWCEWLGQDQREWRGQVEHVASGKTGYFRDWAALFSFIQETLDMLEPNGLPVDPAHNADQNKLNQNGDTHENP